MSELVSWVIGRGGLLGGAVESAFAAAGRTWSPVFHFDWTNCAKAQEQLVSACHLFAETVGDSPWQIAWCAGPGVTASSSNSLAQETNYLEHLLEGIAHAFEGIRLGHGSFFLASSAGGLYGSSEGSPINEESPLVPLTPYGMNKLAQESLVHAWSDTTGIPVFIGRISNLYGPRQNPLKSQGLITQVCLRALTRRPLILHVPSDTIRDYIYADDAGRVISRGLSRLKEAQAGLESERVVIKIVASESPVTVNYVLALVRSILKRPISVLVANAPTRVSQSQHLRFSSLVWPDLNQCAVVSLPEGIRFVVNGLLASISHGVFQRYLFPSYD